MKQNHSEHDVVGRLAEEFLGRYRKGDHPSVSEFVKRCPEHAEEIEDLFPALIMMERVAPQRDESLAEPMSASDQITAPECLGDYHIIREVGRGGMGIVYEAEQQSLGRRVALKILPKQMLLDSKQKRRFIREARSAANLHHTNIVPVFGVGEHDGLQYYAMQFIHGLGLDDVLAELRQMRMKSGSRPALVEARHRESEHHIGEKKEPVRVAGSQKKSPIQEISAANVANSLLTGQFDKTVIQEFAVDEALVLDGEEQEFEIESRGIQASSQASTITSQTPSRKDTAIGRLSDTFSLSGSVNLPGQTGDGSRSSNLKHSYYQSVARIGIQVAEALHYAHDQGILHRDIKPSNLLLDSRGTVWVTDFGLAKSEAHENLTDTGDIVGTLRYMPPEAFSGHSDFRSDIYSLGLTLYELLALKPAFDETDRHSLIKQVTTEVPERLDKRDSSLPKDLVTIIHKTIDREPSQRYQTAGELAEDLQRYLDDEPIRARRISQIARFRRWCRRNKTVASLTTALALLMLIVSIASSIAAAWFRTMADNNSFLAAQKSEALDQSEKDRILAQEAEARAKSAQAEAEDKSRQLSANVDMGLEALEQIYLQYGEQQLATKAELNAADRQFMEKALPFYTAFLEQKRESPETELALARVTTRIGAIQHKLKQFDQSEPALRQAVALWEKITEKEPESISHRVALANARAMLSYTLNDKPDFAAALPVHRQVIDDYSRLMQDVSDQPDQVEYQRRVAFAWRNLGLAYSATDQREQRKDAFQRSVDEYKKVVERASGNADYRYEYAYSLNLLADLQRDDKQDSLAELAYVDAIGRYEEVIDQRPENAELAMNTATGQRAYANFLKNSGRNEEAVKTFEKAVEQFRDLVKLAPGNPTYRVEVAASLNELAHVYRTLGQHSKAMAGWKESVDILTSVTEWWPENQHYHLLMGDCLRMQGVTCFDFKNFKDAEAYLTRAIARVEPRAGKHRHWNHVLGLSHQQLALVADETNRDGMAESEFKAGLASFKVALQNPKRAEHIWDLPMQLKIQQQYAEFLAKRERYTEAFTMYREAIESADEYRRRFNTYDSKQVNLRWELADHLKRAGKDNESAEYARAALDLLPNASIDYKVRITQPGLYRLFLHGSASDRNSDSCFVRIVELCDGPGGRIPDWYHLGLLIETGLDVHRFDWKRRMFQFEKGILPAGHEPAIWEIEKPGDYTIRVLMCEDGFALDSLVLQLASQPFSSDTAFVESARSSEGVHLEQGGRVSIEAENFVSRNVGPADHKWTVIPDEDPGHGARDNSNGKKFVQVLPPNGPRRTLGMPGKAIAHHHYRDRIQLYQKLFTEHKDDEGFRHDLARLHHPLAMQLWQDGDYDAALEALEKCFNSQEDVYGVSRNATNLEYSNTIETLLKLESGPDRRHFQKIVEWQRRPVHNSPFYDFHRDILGWACLRAGYYDEAIEENRLLLNIGENSNAKIVELASRLAWAHAELGNTENAKQWLEITTLWSTSKGLAEKGRFVKFREQAEKALGIKVEPKPGNPLSELDLLQRVIDFDPDAVWAYKKRAELYLDEEQYLKAQGDREEALEAYKRLTAAVPKHRGIYHYLLGYELWQLGRNEEALEDLTAAAKLTPDSIYAWNVRGLVNSRLGNKKEAIADYTRAIELSPWFAVILRNRASTWQELKKYGKAADDWVNVLQLEPDDPRALYRAAETCRLSGRSEEAVSYCTKLIQLSPGKPDYWNQRGLCYWELKQWDEAVHDFTKAMELIPRSSTPVHNRASTFSRMGLQDKALADYGKLIELQPTRIFESNRRIALGFNTRYLQRFQDDPNAWENRGWLHTHYEDQDASEVAFGQAIALAPQSARYRLSRARWRLSREQAEEAVGDLLEAIRLDPDNPTEALSLLRRLVHKHAEQEEWRKAADLLSGAVAFEPNDYRPYYELALFQLATGDMEGYRKTCRAMLRKFGDSNDIHAVRFVAWTCALAPEAIEETHPLIALGRKLADDKHVMNQNTFGAVLFRSGRLADGLRQLEKAESLLTEPYADMRAYTWYLLAMVSRQLGLNEEADVWRQKADTQAAKELNPGEGSNKQIPWSRKVTLNLLRSHTEQLFAADIDSNTQAVMQQRAIYFASKDSKTPLKLPTTAEEWKALAEKLRAENHTAEAVAAVTEAIQLDPQDWYKYYLRGVWRQQLKQFDDAIADYSAAIERNPKNVWPQWGRGQAKHEKGDWEAALIDIDKAIEIQPHAEFYRYRSVALRQLGRLDEALVAAKASVKTDPQFAWAHAELAAVHWSMGRHSEAIADLTKAIEAGGDRKSLQRTRAQYLRFLQEFDEALADCNELIRLDENHVDAIYERGRVYQDIDDSEKALADFDRVLALNSSHELAHSRRSWVYIFRGDYDKALAAADDLLKINPRSMHPLETRTMVYAALGQYDEALKTCEQWIEQFPHAGNASQWRFRILRCSGQLQQALEAAEARSQKTSTRLDGHWELAATYAAMRNWPAAIEQLDRILEGNRDGTSAWYCRMLLSRAAGNNEELAEIAMRRLRKHQDTQDRRILNDLTWSVAVAAHALPDPQIYYSVAKRAYPSPKIAAHFYQIGAASYHNGKYTEALDLFNRGAKEPWIYETFTWIYLAMTHQQLGNTEEARVWLEKTVAVLNQPPASHWSTLWWGNRLELQLLREEAEKLMGVKNDEQANRKPMSDAGNSTSGT